MAISDLVTLGVAVLSLVGLGIQFLPKHKHDAFDRLNSIVDRLDAENEELKEEIKTLKETVDRRDYQHQLERKKWESERKKLTQRIDVLEEALIVRGVDVEEIL